MQRGEVVWSQNDVQRHGGVARVEAMRRLQAGYSDGGVVGAAPGRAVGLASGTTESAAPHISISAPITVEGSSGTPEQNQDLSKRMARQLEQTMRGVVADEILRAMRPGNIGNTRSR